MSDSVCADRGQLDFEQLELLLSVIVSINFPSVSVFQSIELQPQIEFEYLELQHPIIDICDNRFLKILYSRFII